MLSIRSLALAALVVAPVAAQNVPDRVLVGYWHNWSWPNSVPLASVPDAYDVVDVAFAVPTTPSGSTMQFTPNPALYATPQAFANDVASLQAAGKKVLISIGGANDPVVVDTPAKATAFATSMAQIIATYGFDGLDIDLEGGSLSLQAGDTDHTAPTTPRIVHFISGVQQLLQQLPADFLLTAAPETAFVQGGMSAYAGIWGAYLPVLHALRARFDWVHVQHYNTGTMFGRDGQIYSPATADFHVAMADALVGGFTTVSNVAFTPFAPHQVAIGLPATSSAAGSGFTPPAVVQQALERLLLGAPGGSYQLADPNGYPDFRGLMTWSIHWDVHAGEPFSSAHRAYLDGVFLAADATALSQSSGVGANFALTAGRKNALRSYLLIAGFTGTEPGTILPGGAHLPLNFDALSTLSVDPLWASVFVGFSGTLDANGEATAQLLLPTTPSIAGFELSFAYTLGPTWDFASTPVRIHVTP